MFGGRGIDKEIEKSVKQCRKCQQTQVLPPSAPCTLGNGRHVHGQDSISTTADLKWKDGTCGCRLAFEMD